MEKKQRLLCETIVLLSADLYQDIYNAEESWGDAVDKIISLAEEFEEELNWQEEGEERDYIFELDKFEKKVLKKLQKGE
jgi:hypothetical protein